MTLHTRPLYFIPPLLTPNHPFVLQTTLFLLQTTPSYSVELEQDTGLALHVAEAVVQVVQVHVAVGHVVDGKVVRRLAVTISADVDHVVVVVNVLLRCAAKQAN